MARPMKCFWVAAAALAVLASCGPAKTQPAVPDLPLPAQPVVTPTDQLFPSPYFPSRDTQILGRPVAEWGSEWTAAFVYTETALDDRQKAFVAGLEPAGGEGKVGLGFTQDFDGDGRAETVSYGAFAKASGNEGNFLLVTRESIGKPEILLLKEFPGPSRVTAFTLKPDGSLWFGGGIDAGEVTMKLTWDQRKPVFTPLTGD